VVVVWALWEVAPTFGVHQCPEFFVFSHVIIEDLDLNSVHRKGCDSIGVEEVANVLDFVGHEGDLLWLFQVFAFIVLEVEVRAFIIVSLRNHVELDFISWGLVVFFEAAVELPREVLADVDDEGSSIRFSFKLVISGWLSCNGRKLLKFVLACFGDLPRSCTLQPQAFDSNAFTVFTLWVELFVFRFFKGDNFLLEEPSLVGGAGHATDVLQDPGEVLILFGERQAVLGHAYEPSIFDGFIFHLVAASRGVNGLRLAEVRSKEGCRVWLGVREFGASIHP